MMAGDETLRPAGKRADTAAETAGTDETDTIAGESWPSGTVLYDATVWCDISVSDGNLVAVSPTPTTEHAHVYSAFRPEDYDVDQHRSAFYGIDEVADKTIGARYTPPTRGPCPVIVDE